MTAASESALYDIAISELFKRLSGGGATKSRYDFDKGDLEKTIADLYHEGALPKIIRNIPDIKYTYDARRNFPSAVAASGFWAVIGRGKSKYSFVKLQRNNLVRVPDDLPSSPAVKNVKDRTPALANSVLGDDEQATFARVRYNDLLADFLNMTVYAVQSHERTTVSAGQIEIDEVYVGENAQKEKFVIPISGKGGDKDCLSYSQAYNLNLYSSEKTRYRGLKGIPVGIVKKPNGLIWMIRFSTDTDITKIQIVNTAAYRLT